MNDINFENMSNDDAVRVLRDVVQKPGPIKLVVAKCWDPNPKDYFSVPRTEPVGGATDLLTSLSLQLSYS